MLKISFEKEFSMKRYELFIVFKGFPIILPFSDFLFVINFLMVFPLFLDFRLFRN